MENNKNVCVFVCVCVCACARTLIVCARDGVSIDWPQQRKSTVKNLSSLTLETWSLAVYLPV
jgi:hypothetical protein